MLVNNCSVPITILNEIIAYIQVISKVNFIFILYIFATINLQLHESLSLTLMLGLPLAWMMNAHEYILESIAISSSPPHTLSLSMDYMYSSISFSVSNIHWYSLLCECMYYVTSLRYFMWLSWFPRSIIKLNARKRQLPSAKISFR